MSELMAITKKHKLKPGRNQREPRRKPMETRQTGGGGQGTAGALLSSRCPGSASSHCGHQRATAAVKQSTGQLPGRTPPPQLPSQPRGWPPGPGGVVTGDPQSLTRAEPRSGVQEAAALSHLHQPGLVLERRAQGWAPLLAKVWTSRSGRQERAGPQNHQARGSCCGCGQPEGPTRKEWEPQ